MEWETRLIQVLEGPGKQIVKGDALMIPLVMSVGQLPLNDPFMAFRTQERDLPQLEVFLHGMGPHLVTQPNVWTVHCVARIVVAVSFLQYGGHTAIIGEGYFE